VPEISYIKHGDSLTYYNTISFPFTQAASNESCSAEGALVVRDTKRIEANCVDVVTAMVNEVQIQVPVKNDSEHAVEVQANDILARRAVVAQFPQVKAEPLKRPLT